MSPRDTKLVMLGMAGLIAVGALVLVILLVSGSFDASDESYRPIAVVPFTDDSLLSVEVAGLDGDNAESRIRVIANDGEVRAEVTNDALGWLTYHGTADGVVWLQTRRQGVHTRSVQTLALVGDHSAALKALGEYTVLGLTEGGLAIRAGDRSEHRLAVDSTTSPLPKGTPYRRIGEKRTFIKADGRYTHEGVAVTPASIAKGLVRPSFVADHAAMDVVRFDDGFLLHSDTSEGPEQNAVLTRASADGTQRWTASVKDIMGPLLFDEKPEFTAVWAGWMGDQLWVMTSAHVTFKQETDRWSLGELKLAQLDADTGAVLHLNNIASPQAKLPAPEFKPDRVLATALPK